MMFRGSGNGRLEVGVGEGVEDRSVVSSLTLTLSGFGGEVVWTFPRSVRGHYWIRGLAQAVLGAVAPCPWLCRNAPASG